jgi:hypothetical protein
LRENPSRLGCFSETAITVTPRGTFAHYLWQCAFDAARLIRKTCGTEGTAIAATML